MYLKLCILSLRPQTLHGYPPMGGVLGPCDQSCWGQDGGLDSGGHPLNLLQKAFSCSRLPDADPELSKLSS